MTTHSSVLAWRILWTEEPGRRQLEGLRVRHTRVKQFSVHTRTASKLWLLYPCYYLNHTL